MACTHKRHPYLTIAGELWGVYCEDFGEITAAPLYTDDVFLPLLYSHSSFTSTISYRANRLHGTLRSTQILTSTMQIFPELYQHELPFPTSQGKNRQYPKFLQYNVPYSYLLWIMVNQVSVYI